LKDEHNTNVFFSELNYINSIWTKCSSNQRRKINIPL